MGSNPTDTAIEKPLASVRGFLLLGLMRFYLFNNFFKSLEISSIFIMLPISFYYFSR